MNNEVRKSRIYTYFHGSGNIFQQFVAVVGILCIFLGIAAGQARNLRIDNAQQKHTKLQATATELKKEYQSLYNDYTTSDSYNFNCKLYEEAEIAENDKNSNEKTAYNNALKAYNDAEAKVKAACPSIALREKADECKATYETIYNKYQYKYWFNATKYAAIEISEYDYYESEKTAYNNALNAYLEAEQKAKVAEDAEKNNAEIATLVANSEKLKTEYENLHRKYTEGAEYNFICTKFEEIDVVKGEKYTEEKTALNKALKEYSKADEKATKALNKYESLIASNSIFQVILQIIGFIAVAIGLIWSIIKKFTLNKKAGEEAYDEEIQIKIEDAKVKALEKLNIVAEQIENVEPVVLNGIAAYDSASSKKAVGRFAGLFHGIFSLFSSIKVIIIGAVAAAVYAAISSVFGGAFFIPVIVAIALAVVLGIKVYNKYEKESYVEPKIFEKLEKMYPNLMFRLGTDNRVRASLPAITVYMFGDEQIYMYYQYFDIVTGKIFFEGVHEYFYEDIVGVVSAQETKKLFKRAGLFKKESVDYLKESITVVSSGCQHSESYIVPMGSSLLDTSFVGMRNLIRQKKSDNE